jgi:CubicO group peptidase (beta-lactamase class C family)
MFHPSPIRATEATPQCPQTTAGWTANSWRRNGCVIALLALLAPPPALAQSDTTSDELQTFLAVAEELRTTLNVAGVGIGIVVDGQTIHVGGLGYSDVSNQVAVTENTLFAIGSNTKSFTGVVANKLVSEGLLDWHKPIANYIPDFELSAPYVAANMTLEDACSHMTGLARRDDLWKGQPLTRQQVYEQVRTLPFDHGLRKDFSYNNHMYVVAGVAIESVSGKAWEANIKERVFAPLGMTDSYVTYNEFVNHPRKSIGYEFDGASVMPHLNIDNVAPAGSIATTPKDYAKWLEMWANKGQYKGQSFLTSAEFQRYYTPRSASLHEGGVVQFYLAGWGAKMVNNQLFLQHSGGIDGQNAVIFVRPDDRFGVFVMTNQRSDYKDLMADYAEQIFVDKDFRRDKKREKDLAAVADFIAFRRHLLESDIARASEFYKTIQHNSLEVYMNDLGYELMESGELEKARFAFETNVSDHPDSSNAYDSLGECHFKLKNYELSLANYTRSLELDPSNGNAERLIGEIRAIQDNQGVAIDN